MRQSTPSVTIRGGGIAAWCSAFLLQKAGIAVEMQETGRAKLPAILLSTTALALLRDIFSKPDLFCDRPLIQKRVVAWGPNAPPVSLDHAAVVVSEADLIDNVRSIGAFAQNPLCGKNTSVDWTIIAYHPLPSGCEEHRFGFRTGCVAPVELAVDSTSACWIEALEHGWLFLIENSGRTGWIFGVGDRVSTLLTQSTMIGPRIAQTGDAGPEIPVYPRILSPLCDRQWLACGNAAMAFDPICGDGTAHAVREAILASAVIRAAMQDSGEIHGLLSHYETRLLVAFQRHLAMCLDFYGRGHCGPWWEQECAALRRGLEWCRSKLGKGPEFHYRLEGFDLRSTKE